MDFVRAFDLFKYGRIRYRDARGRQYFGIFVKCPKCNGIGKLKPQRIEHKDESCRFGYCIDGLYVMCSSMEPWIRADKPDLDEFLRWLTNESGLSKSSILSVLSYVNTLLNRFGVVNLGELEWILDVKETTIDGAYEWFWRWYRHGKC